MSHLGVKSVQSSPDAVPVDLATYAKSFEITREEAYDTARHGLMDALASGFQALADPACARLLGPVVPGATMAGGARVPGTSYELDPVQAAFNIGAMTGWRRCDDVGPVAECTHPSDSLGGILAVADYLARKALAEGGRPPTVRDVLTAMIKAHEIQGVIALEHGSRDDVADPAPFVRVASTAVVTAMLGGTREQIRDAVSNAWLDGGALHADRHERNPASGGRWTAADATSRAVRLALLARAGDTTCASAPAVGRSRLHDLPSDGRPVFEPRPFGSAVMERLQFSIGFPGAVHTQTAVECALALHPQVRDRLDQVERVVVETQAPGMRLGGRSGPLAGPAERARCLRYQVAIPLIFGRLNAADYEDPVASDPRVDALRAQTTVRESARFTAEHRAPDKRHIGNSVQVFFRDGTGTDRVAVDVPPGHRQRRVEGIPALLRKFEASIAEVFGAKQRDLIRSLCAGGARIDAMPVHQFVAAFVNN